jgi:hypothetical protein
VYQSAKWDVETSPRGSVVNLSAIQGASQSSEINPPEDTSSASSGGGVSATVTEKPPRPARSRLGSSAEAREGERIEQVAQGVYLTLRSNAVGETELRRVRFRWGENC